MISSKSVCANYYRSRLFHFSLSYDMYLVERGRSRYQQQQPLYLKR